MNRRDKFWISNLLRFTGIVLLFGLIFLYNIIHFNHSYMTEEYDELKVFQKQIEWAVKPYLEQNDIQTIKNYCNEFTEKSIKIRIFDKNKTLIASSNKSDTEPLRENCNTEKLPPTSFQSYRASTKNKMIGIVKEITAHNTHYYIEITISEEDVMKSILAAQANLFIFIFCAFVFFICGYIYILQKIRRPFNKLQDSVIKIANGALDTEIEIPKLAVLEELAIAVKKMAQRLKNQILRLKLLEEYKNDFIQNLSHEIKTPITAINSAIELIEENKNSDKTLNKECFNIIQFQVNAINSLVNDILSLAELTVEKTDEHKNFKNFILNDAIKEVINYTPANGIKINFKQNKNISLYGDYELIKRAVTNLLVNAIKYSKSDVVEFIITQEDKTVKIQVKDYGIGIAEEHLPFIFERFYRIDKARSRKNGGTGLGLAITKNIIELHNGKISVDSELGKGTTFTITLPLDEKTECNPS